METIIGNQVKILSSPAAVMTERASRRNDAGRHWVTIPEKAKPPRIRFMRPSEPEYLPRSKTVIRRRMTPQSMEAIWFIKDFPLPCGYTPFTAVFADFLDKKIPAPFWGVF